MNIKNERNTNWPSSIGLGMMKVTMFLFMLCWSTSTFGQDVENVINQTQARLKENPLTVSGRLSLNSQFAEVFGDGPRRANPFLFNGSAQLNIDFLGINVPFSAIYSSGSNLFNYNLPAYSFVGLSPSYKGLTLHVGNRSLMFSPYTLNGHSFNGVGVELKSNKFSYTAMYGRLRRAQAEDLNTLSNIEPAYRRIGAGIKLGYGDEEEKIELMVFKGVDEENSIPFPTQRLDITPGENAVIALTLAKRINIFKVNLEYAYNAFTKNKTDALNLERSNFFERMGGLIVPKQSTGYYSAFKTSVGVKVWDTDLQMNYERIDPGYRTLGSLFYDNDREDVFLSAGRALFNNRVMVNGRLGLQRNNLADTEFNAFNRVIGALMTNVTVTDRFQVNLNYSNFTMTNKMRSPNVIGVGIDSLNIVVTNESLTFNSFYALGEDRKSAITGLFSYQRANQVQNEEVNQSQTSNTYVGQVSLQQALALPGWRLVSSFQTFIADFSSNESQTFGLTNGLTKSWEGIQMNLGGNVGYSIQNSAGQFAGSFLTASTNFNYRFLQNHGMAISLFYIDQVGNDVKSDGFSEFRGRVSYSYQFKPTKRN